MVVVLGEAEPSATGRRRGPDRQREPLRELHRLVPRTGRVDVGAGDHRRPARRLQPARERVHRRGIRAGAAGHRARRRKARRGLVGLLLPVVHRDRDERGAARRQRREVDGAGERRRHVLRARGLEAPLHVGVRHAHGVAVGEVRLRRDVRAHLLAGGEQQRRLVGLGVEDRAHRVAQARRGVQVGVGHAARRLRVAVGHPHDHRLLQAEDVPEVLGEAREHRQLGRARVAEDGRHPPRAEEVEGGVADGRHALHRMQRGALGPRTYVSC